MCIYIPWLHGISMLTKVGLGCLVCSDRFTGIGKVLSLSSSTNVVTVGFFESPLSPEAREQEVAISSLKSVTLYDEATVYCQDLESGIWRRGRYGGRRPDNGHLVIFRSEDDDKDVFLETDIYCLNLAPNTYLNPADFLADWSNDAPYFCLLRENFVRAYIEQRSACRSIAAIPSSSIEFEPHQLAVVRRVLTDPVQKYLLADEVGLGKTIEAGLIIREHVLERKQSAIVVIAVPQGLLEQWKEELTWRFHLGELIATEDNPELPIHVCDHLSLASVIEQGFTPTLLTVDEAHQIAPLAWSEDEEEQQLFNLYSHTTQEAEVALLLSGTPLNGNEKNFLAMLHCLNPCTYSLTVEGVASFLSLIRERELIGGLYSALAPQSPNPMIEGVLNELSGLSDADLLLSEKIEEVRKNVDFFAPEEGEERDQSIASLRTYIGDHYRLHQRMLRNRRESSSLALLFPGLSGLTTKAWNEAGDLSVDDLIEEYRSISIRDPDMFIAMGESSYLDWVDALLLNPLCVAERALHELNNLGNRLLAEEQEILKHIIEIATDAQKLKDSCLQSELRQWLLDNPEGKAVVFCGTPEVACHLFNQLNKEFGDALECHEVGYTPRFCKKDSDVRVLICDKRGEDGLNLHGGTRLAVHYSVPRSFSRFEQRLGRLNRYSANLKRVRPVKSLALIPCQTGITHCWVNLLDEAVGLFDATVASLQYVLEENLEHAWKYSIKLGDIAIQNCANQLKGENGLLALERRRVKAQEELLAMDEDVELAADFADQLAESDDIALEQATKMAAWIRNALQFKQLGRIDEDFRFSFLGEDSNRGRTLVDIDSFLSNCITGIDFDRGYPPTTMSMSGSRSHVAVSERKGVYPFRYGQPFVDSIWNLLQLDSRGSTSAFMRCLMNVKLSEPKTFFKLNWLVSASTSQQGRISQRRGDEILPPAMHTLWLGDDGKPALKEIISFLEMPYKKIGQGYRDLNLRHNRWEQLDGWTKSDWKHSVDTVLSLGNDIVTKKVLMKEGLEAPPSIQLLSMHAVILCSPETFTGSQS